MSKTSNSQSEQLKIVNETRERTFQFLKEQSERFSTKQ